MSKRNKLGHVVPAGPKIIRASGLDIEFEELGLDHLSELMRRFPSFEKKLNGEDVIPDEAEWKELCSVAIAMALEPSLSDKERAETEESARNMRRIEREIAFMTIFKRSFPEYEEAFTESEAAMGSPLATKPKPVNRAARRATRSKSTKTKPQT